jgi:precorrin-2 dehydrogenase/sirohydrochlorin ferrochelatase
MAAYLYPIALDVRGKKCVVVGGGAVGARKASALLDAGAAVTVVAPERGDAVLWELAAAGRVRHLEEMFAPHHLDDALLAVAATDSPAVNAAVADAARARGVLLNLAAPTEDGSEGDFATMATVRRGDLLVAVTTGGAGPALSARLRRELDERFGAEWGPYVNLLGEMRARARTQYATERERTEALRRLADRATVRERLAAGDEAGARLEALACLS